MENVATQDPATSKPTKERKMVHARIAPRFVHALAPLIRQVDEMAHSDYFFFNQVNTRSFGSYLIPVEQGGVILAVVDSYRFFAVLDPKGDSTESIKVHFPDPMLDALAPKVVTLSSEDGVPFEVEAEPKADCVLITDILGFVGLDKTAEKKWKGCMGSWLNGDHGNVIDMTSYRAEPANASFIGRVVKSSDSQPRSALQLNPHLLTPLSEAANRLGVLLDFQFGGEGGPVTLRSRGDVEAFGMIMPVEYEALEKPSAIQAALLNGVEE
jgi:hypothetical protein